MNLVAAVIKLIPNLLTNLTDDGFTQCRRDISVERLVDRAMTHNLTHSRIELV